MIAEKSISLAKNLVQAFCVCPPVTNLRLKIYNYQSLMTALLESIDVSSYRSLVTVLLESVDVSSLDY